MEERELSIYFFGKRTISLSHLRWLYGVSIPRWQEKNITKTEVFDIYSFVVFHLWLKFLTGHLCGDNPFFIKGFHIHESYQGARRSFPQEIAVNRYNAASSLPNNPYFPGNEDRYVIPFSNFSDCPHLDPQIWVQWDESGFHVFSFQSYGEYILTRYL